jgi:deoxyribodipyrimidine photo-lyase
VPVPQIRIRKLNAAPLRTSGEYVLYWMLAARRRHHNFALDRAVELARELGKPLLILEALTAGHRWASERFHAFVIAGMADNRSAFSNTPAFYYPYVELEAKAGHGLVETLAERAAIVVTDEFPCFFLPQLAARMAERLSVRLEAIDGNGMLPLHATDKAFARAFDFRRFLLRVLPEHAACAPRLDALRGAQLPKLPALSRNVLRRWPMASDALLDLQPRALAELPINHHVAPGSMRGGFKAAQKQLRTFVNERLERYAELRNHPDAAVTSDLSPYLHFGHIGAHEVFAAVAKAEDWSVELLAEQRRGEPKAVWQMRPGAEAFLDQLVTWRELGYNFCSQRPADYDSYGSLPEWAKASLAKHAKDPRERLYSLAQLEAGDTYDELWNAAQRELVETGRMQNYLRMLWGKLVLAWSKTPEAALETLLELNNKYALDGRDPNSYSGIFWCFGRYDRPWGPERPIFGLVRYMTSESALRKLRLKGYLQRFGRESIAPRRPGL